MKKIIIFMLAVLSLIVVNGCHSPGGSFNNAITAHYVKSSLTSSMSSMGAQMMLPFAADGCAKLAPVVINKCSTLTPGQKKEYEGDLKETKDLNKALFVYKSVPCGNPLEKKAKLKIILILRDYELPKAKTADDFLNLCNRMPWNLCDVKKKILRCAVDSLDNKYEIQKIVDVIYPKSDPIAVAGYAKIKKIEKKLKSNKKTKKR